MAKRQTRVPGAILEIQTNAKYYYAQILHKGCAFFDLELDAPLKDYSVLKTASVLFIVAVYNDVITKGKWLKVGKMEIRDELKIVPNQFIQDPINPIEFSLYNPNTGEILPSSRKDVEGLECAAVWEAEHVEDRLRDHFAGNPNVWVAQLAIK